VIETYFLITKDGVYRKDIDTTFNLWSQLPMRSAAMANQIIKLTSHGKGVTVKNRYSDCRQFFSEDEMTMIALRAESV